MANARGLSWDWRAAALGLAYAIPAAIVAPSDPTKGLSLAVGVLPAAALGLAPRRADRRRLAVLGLLTGVAMFIGGLLTGIPVLAVAAIFLLAVASAALAREHPVIGQVAMVLSLPLVAVGLSYTDVGEAATLGLLMAASGLYAWVVALAFPTWPEPPRPATAPAPPITLDYGVRLGLAGACAAGVGYALDLSHVGWGCAAALFVMRPAHEMLVARSLGRAGAVLAGSLVSLVWIEVHPADGWLALAIVATLIGACGVHASRWYVSAAFSTFLVMLLLLASEPGAIEARWVERVLATLLGIGLAYVFGVGVPLLRDRLRR